MGSENINSDFNIGFKISKGLNMAIALNLGANDSVGNCINQEEQGIKGTFGDEIIGGLKASKSACEEPPQREWYSFSRNGDDWLIVAHYNNSEYPDRNATSEDRVLIKQILSTFKFTN